ncbi:hypothetical protein EU546_06935 [Candidatus Thorarchaeota archaeon]|nr:MAG: hypothetical protein EU546_06935 [Candidatus Thorarchaeota archaeon]
MRVELEKLGIVKPKVTSEVKSEIRILDALDRQGVKIDSSEVKVGAASNDTVSVGLVFGRKTGPLGSAFVRLLTTPKVGQEALTVILEPNLAVKPSALMFPIRTIKSMRQASLFYGPVQSGAGKAVATYLERGVISKMEQDEFVMIMAMDVNLYSRNRRQITQASQSAVEEALTEIWGE